MTLPNVPNGIGASSASPYPAGATPVTGTSGNVANASAVASLPAVTGRTNYLTGVDFSPGGATTAAEVLATVAGLISGNVTYVVGAPAGVGIPGGLVALRFNPAVPASAVNTAITATLPALGVGNAQATVNLYGYLI